MKKEKIEAILEDIAKNVFNCEYKIIWTKDFLEKAFISIAEKHIENKKINMLSEEGLCDCSEIGTVSFKKEGCDFVSFPLYISFVLKDNVMYCHNTEVYGDSWEPYVFHSENGLDYAINLVEVIYDPACEYPDLLDINNDDLIEEIEEKIFKPFNERNNTKLMYWCGMFTSYTETEVINYQK